MSLKSYRITTFDKPQDKFLSCEIHASEENDKDFNGGLFSLVEIQSPLPSIIPIAKTIINTCIREYYRVKDEKPGIRFEIALKKVNETLTHYTQNGVTEWLGKINSVLLLINQKEIHITSVGTPVTYLLRDGKFVNLLEDQATANDTHPLHTYANLTSGELKIGDIIVIANPQFLDIIEKKDLKEIIELSTMEEAVSLLTDEIRQTPHLPNLILIEILKIDESADSKAPPPQTIFLDKITDPFLAKTRNILKKKLTPKIAATTSLFATLLGGLGFFLKKTSPHVKEASGKTLSFIGNSTTKAGLLKNRFIRKPAIEKLDNLTEEISGLEDIQVSHYHEDNFFTRLFKRKPQNKLKQILMQMFKYLRNIKLPKQRYKLWRLVFIALGIVLIASVAIKTRHMYKPASKSASASYSQFEEQLAAIENLPNKDAIPQLTQVISDTSKDPSLHKINQSAKAKLRSITNSAAIKSEKTIPVPANSSYFYQIKEKYFIITSDGNIYSSKSSKPNFVLETSLPSNDNTLITSSLLEDNKILLFTQQKNLYQFLPSLSQLKTVPLRTSSAWPEATKLTSFDKNLYFLDSNTGKLWKYVSYANRYSNPYDYSQNETARLTGAKSVSIGDTIHILTSKNKILNINKNSASSITPSNFPSSLQEIPDDAYQVISNPKSNELIIISSKKITILSENGYYAKELLLSDSSANPSYSFLKKNTLFILSKDSLKTYNLD